MDTEAGDQFHNQVGFKNNGGPINNSGDEVIVFDMKQMEQQQRSKNQGVVSAIGNNISGSMSSRKRAFSKLRQMNGGDGGGAFVEMREFNKEGSVGHNTAAKYQKQGLGGYDDEENDGDYSEINLENSIHKDK